MVSMLQNTHTLCRVWCASAPPAQASDVKHASGRIRYAWHPDGLRHRSGIIKPEGGGAVLIAICQDAPEIAQSLLYGEGNKQGLVERE